MNAPVKRPAPSRARPFDKTQQATPKLKRLLLGRDLAPTPLEYERVCDALWQGDPAMDSLVDWMFEYGPKEGRALIMQALNEGYGSIPDCPEPIKAFFKPLDNPPSWVDWDLINDGIRFIHASGEAATYVLRDLALMGGYLLSGFNQSLVMTGALNNGTQRRVAETGKWWIDCTEPDGLRRFGAGFKSTLHVRMIHALVRRSLAANPDWDEEEWGLPLSQVDMVATYLGFSVVMLGGLKLLGVLATPRETKGVLHLWSYACWLMGVDKEWLVESEAAGAVLLHHTIMTQSKANWTTRELATALAAEPKERTYHHFEAARRFLAYHQHLSVSQYFLGTEKMVQLGLPAHVTPWFPVLTTPPRMISYLGHRVVPGLRRVQEKRGRKAQHDTLLSMFGTGEQGVIKPSKDHPAHI